MHWLYDLRLEGNSAKPRRELLTAISPELLEEIRTGIPADGIYELLENQLRRLRDNLNVNDNRDVWERPFYALSVSIDQP